MEGHIGLGRATRPWFADESRRLGADGRARRFRPGRFAARRRSPRRRVRRETARPWRAVTLRAPSQRNE